MDDQKKYAFYDADTFILTAWGWGVESQCCPYKTKCDIRLEVPWDFEFEPEKWKWNGTEFEALDQP